MGLMDRLKASMAGNEAPVLEQPDWYPADVETEFEWDNLSNEDKADVLANPDKYKELLGVDEEDDDENKTDDKKVEETPPEVVDAVKKGAFALAKIARQDEHLQNIMRLEIDSTERVRRNVPTIWLEFIRVFGKDGVNQMAVPGSPGTNDVPIKWGPMGNIYRPVDKYVIGSGSSRVQSSYFKDLALGSFPDVAASFEAAVKIKDAIDNVEGAPQKYRDLPNVRRVALRRREQQRVTAAESMCRKAVKLNDKINEIENMLYVKVELSTDEHRPTKANPKPTPPKDQWYRELEGGGFETLSVGPMIFLIGPSGQMAKAEPFSYNQVLRMDVEKAKENGGTFDALKATIARKPRTPNGEGAENKSVGIPADAISNAATFEAGLAAFNNFMLNQDRTDNDPKATAAVAKWLNTGSKDEQRQKLILFGDHVMSLDNLWATYGDKYNKAKAEEIAAHAIEEEAEKQKREEKLAKTG